MRAAAESPMNTGSATVPQCVILKSELRRCGGRPLLFWLLREFLRYGVSEVLLPRASAAEQQSVAEVVAMLPRPVRTVFALEPGPTEAATLFAARRWLHNRFLLCGGDVLFDGNLGALLAESATARGPVAAEGASIRAKGGAATGGESVRAAEGAVRLLHRDWLEPSGAGAMTSVAGRGTRIGGPLGCDRGEASVLLGDSFPAGLRRRALFLDRDGVINLDHGYVGSRDRFEWVTGALDAIRYASAAGWHVFIVTNQSGVARGLFDEAAVCALLDWIGDQARAAGGTIDDVRYCPYHPDGVVERYRQAHPWRKPLPGMLLDLIEAWELDASRAVMVGDQASDMRAAAAAGMASFLFPGGNLLEFLRPVLASVS